MKVIGGTLATLLCLFTWLVVAMDYGDGFTVGTYIFKHSNESSVLTLKPDHTFRQTRRLGDDEQRAEGTWRHEGEGSISLSKEFLVVAGGEPEPDGTAFSDIHKFLGLFPSLALRQYHVLWYGKTGDGNSLIGDYKGDEPNVIATLTLNADHSFAQSLMRENITKQASGTWSQDSDGTVRFSKQFLKTSGEPLSPDEVATSITPNPSLQIEISKSERVAEPVFHRRFLFW